MDLNNIEELIKVLEGSRTEEISVRKGEFAVHIKKGGKKAKAAGKAARAGAVAAAKTVEGVEEQSNAASVLAPMVGVFHAADGVCKVGSTIDLGQVIGTIESMKLLNDVVSDQSGVVREVLVEDGMPVEYGQALCRVEPA